MNIDIFSKFFTKKLSFAFFIGAVLVSSPNQADAGFFSMVSDLFDKKEETTTIEKQYNSQNTKLLYAALNLDPNPAKGGGDIIIVGKTALLPETGPSGTLADVEENKTSTEQISLYVVREGDSLSQIADMFDVTVNTVIWANDINRGDLVRVGQTLAIMPVSGVQHTVEKGDTLAKITKKYKGDVDEVLEYNGFEEGVKLAVGETVFIPNGVIKTAPKASKTTTTSASGRSSLINGFSGPTISGYYIRPLSGGIKTQGLHGYNAVDIGAPVGTPIFASASGDVTIARKSGWNGGYGNYIAIKHPNGTQTVYGHASKVIVNTGQHVVQGQIIGYVGSTGRSTGPHIHFEIRGAKNPF